jgi:hypothetical protein
MCCLSYENEVYKTLRAEERLKPQNLAEIRDEMEEHQGATVSKLKRTSLRDVLDEDADDSLENAAPLVEVHTRRSETPSRSRERGRDESTPPAEMRPPERTRGPIPATDAEAFEDEDSADDTFDQDSDRLAPPAEDQGPGIDDDASPTVSAPSGDDGAKRRRRGKRGGKGRR